VRVKGFLVYLFGALGLGSLLDGAAKLTVPDLGGGRGLIVGGISMAIWIPIHRWLTHHDPGPCVEEVDAPTFVTDDGHRHRCTKRATSHVSHDCACGMSWRCACGMSQPPKLGLISHPGPLTAEQAAEFQAKWLQAHAGRKAAINLATMTHADGSACVDPSNPTRPA
jgi:hypothetical protein